MELIDSFNLLLRSSMSIHTDFISINEELACVKSFLNIFEIRYDYPINIKIMIEEGVEEVRIPKLILQPIVENSAYHGILPMDGDGMIEIRVTKTDRDSILIEVEDNGVGMSEAKVSELLSMNSTKEGQEIFAGKKGFNNIGLKNINDRLLLYYGEAYQLNIKSKEDVGTIIFFEIPLICLGDDTNDNDKSADS